MIYILLNPIVRELISLVQIYVLIFYSVSGLLRHKSFRAFRAASSILFRSLLIDVPLEDFAILIFLVCDVWLIMLRILLHVSVNLLLVSLFWLLALTGVLALFVLLVLLVVLVLHPCRFCILAGQLRMVLEHSSEASLRRAAG